MTPPLQGGDRQFESARAHFFIMRQPSIARDLNNIKYYLGVIPQQLSIEDNLSIVFFRVSLFILPIFFIINSLSNFNIFSTFIQHFVGSFPSSKLVFSRVIVYLFFEIFEVTPTTITSSEYLLNSPLLITITGLTFLPD